MAHSAWHTASTCRHASGSLAGRQPGEPAHRRVRQRARDDDDTFDRERGLPWCSSKTALLETFGRVQYSPWGCLNQRSVLKPLQSCHSGGRRRHLVGVTARGAHANWGRGTWPGASVHHQPPAQLVRDFFHHPRPRRPNFRCFSLVEIRSAFFSRFFIYDRTDFSSETLAKRYRFCQQLLRRSSNCSVLR